LAQPTIPLKRSVLSAVGWAGATRFAAQLANWAMTLVTVRLLRPEDYGLMAITMAIGGFLASTSAIGFANVIVQNRRIGDEELRAIFGVILVIHVACQALLCAVAPLVAWFYGEPRLVALLLVASLMFLPLALQTIPRATLEKKLDLKTTSRVDLVSNISGGALVLLLAWCQAGVWSLVVGMLFTASLKTVGLGLAAPYFRRPHFTYRNLTEIFRFGGLRSAESALWSIYSESDVFIIGRLLGSHALGIYWVIRLVAALPVEKLMLVIGPVVFPAFAQVQHDRSEALQYLEKGIRLLAFLCLPVFFGLAATAPQTVDIVLGPQWSQAEAATPLAVLALGMALRPIGVLVAPFLVAIGEYVASFKNTLFATTLFPLAFIVGSYWGLIGVCAAWLVAYPLQLGVLLRRVSLVTKVSLPSLLLPLLPPLVGAVIMFIAVRLTAGMLPAEFGIKTSLAVLIGTGGLVYFGYAAIALRPIFAEFFRLVR
jgi:O-antigen/teichoic acid export membrane protein